MATKTFRAPTMLQALQQVKNDLGSDALVVSVRQVLTGPAWQVWQKPVCEIVATDQLNAKNENSIVNPEPVSRISQNSKPGGTQKFVDQDHVSLPVNTPSVMKRQNNPSPEEVEAVLNKISPLINNLNVKNLNTIENSSMRINSSTGSITPKDISRSIDKEKHLEGSGNQANPWEADSKDQKTVYGGTLRKIYSHLENQELDHQVLRKIFQTCVDTLGPGGMSDEGRIKAHLKGQLEANIKSFQMPHKGLPFKVAVLLGASGSGKTSAGMKIAIHSAHNFGKKVAWICCDTVRAGAIAEATTLTSTLGISLHLAYNPQDVQDIILENKSVDQFILDTPGCNPYDEKSVINLGSYLIKVPGRITFLTTPATMKEQDLNQLAAAFSPLSPEGIVITKLDETRTFGGIYNLAWKNKLSLAFFSKGTDLFDDFSPADHAKFVDALFKGKFS